MQLDWIWGLLGGGLIGVAAALYLLGNGRIMGASGIVGSLVDGTAGNAMSERMWLIIGLIAVPAAVVMLGGIEAQTHLTPQLAVVITGGVLVGIGTRVANGCTSGHGVCGISRLSPRGIVASVVYIAAGALTMVLLRLVGVIA
jgi:uncharacterized membrane protein YedE/YeeE